MKDPILEAYGACTPKHILDNPMMREQILRHMRGIVRVFQQQFSGYSNLTLNNALLRETVESCLCDVYRLKFFRGIDQEDIHKRATFFMIWLAKIKPIQLTATSVQSRAEIFANELLALFFGLNMLDMSPKQLAANHPQYFENVPYLLHFHSCSPEQLASELYLLEEIGSSKR
jgi:hypothetical protein